MMIYSEPGAGKTCVACSAPRTLLLNADGPDGPESARMMGYDPSVWDIENFRDLDRAYNLIRKYPDRYDWVWLDSISIFQESGMDDVMEAMLAKAKHRNPYVPDRPEYQETQRHLGLWIRHMSKLPVNFGITAHEMRLVDPDDDRVTYLPDIQGGQGRFANKVCGYMGVVGHLEVKMRKEEGKSEELRVLRVRREGKYYAKDRYHALGKGVVNPTIPKIVSLIEQAKPVAGRPARRRKPSVKSQVRRQRQRP